MIILVTEVLTTCGQAIFRVKWTIDMLLPENAAFNSLESCHPEKQYMLIILKAEFPEFKFCCGMALL